MPNSRRLPPLVALLFLALIAKALLVDESLRAVLGTNLAMGGLGLLTVVAMAAVERHRNQFDATRLAVETENNRLREYDQRKDRFLASAAHDLKTPLTAIVGYAELLVDGSVGDLQPDQKQFLHVMDRNARRLESMLDDLVLMARIDTGALRLEKASFDLVNLVLESVEKALPGADDKGLSITFVPPEAVEVTADRRRVGQAIANLLARAITRSPSNGQVDLRVDLTPSQALIGITDSGGELLPEEQRQLFDRFYWSGRGAAAVGLGLSIVRSIAEAHEGSALVSSTQRGSTITLAFPLVSNRDQLARSGAHHGE
jgi:two-component system, OmpR family, phosphate regulon sensor histidine kinase PhoR